MANQFLQPAGNQFFKTGGTGGGGSGYVYNNYPSGQYVKPLLADFNTSLLPGSATLTEDAYGLVMSQTGGAATMAFAYQTAPAAPYTVTALVQGLAPGRVQLGFRDSTSGRLMNIVPYADAAGNYTIYISRSNALNTYSGDIFVQQVSVLDPTMWFRIADDGTNVVFSASPNGLDFVQLASEAKATYLTAPDQIGFGVSTIGLPDVAVCRLLSWAVA